MSCQNKNSTQQNNDVNNSSDAQAADTAMLAEAYEQYKETSITKKRFKHADLEPLLHRLTANPQFKLHRLGESVQKRNIYQVEYGTGPKKVMLWSQMHGDESTATMALLDIFNFLAAEGDGFDTVRNLIRDNTHLYFIPMLNPDGAEIFNRRNAMAIDINRDARSGTTPEGKILIDAAKNVQPDYGFNLHDQQPYYSAGYNKTPATISFLAPAYNYERDTNEVRADAMRMIVGMNKLLQNYIPDGVAKYDDTHEPRGFGDNFQKWGARTVLIESGGYPNDPEKQYIRKLNFFIILNGLIDIATDNYKHYSAGEYDSIPENTSKHHDLVIRNLTYQSDTLRYKTDLGINQNTYSLDDGDYYVRGIVADVGDLLESAGYKEIDADGFTMTSGKVYEKTFATLNQLSSDQAWELVKQGYYAVRIEEMPDDRAYSLPLLVLTDGNPPGGGMHLGMAANFFLSKGGRLQYAVINGYLIDLNNTAEQEFKQYVR
ncbi:M14 family zinc carboxypeptidase [Albibacterium indicum]|uniref:M14 family zinc carboxypeptidase n=1 Tax=Albibacterium indicum TaxID=2292082 RepID=UPI0013003730|nr:M14 family zinc carboxypeptidase [Pedobacter indicus]